MTESTNEAQIRNVVEQWAKAVRDGNMEGVVSNHTDDIVMFDVPPPQHIRGIAAYRRQWVPFFAESPGGEGSFDLAEVGITASDTVAFCHAFVNVSGLNIRLTLGLRKERGQWLIAHEHHSELEEAGQ